VAHRSSSDHNLLSILSAHTIILVSINIGGMHWTLLWLQDGLFHHADPTGWRNQWRSQSCSLLAQQSAYSGLLHNAFDPIQVPCSRQTNSTECGIHVLHNAKAEMLTVLPARCILTPARQLYLCMLRDTLIWDAEPLEAEKSTKGWQDTRAWTRNS
jgi:hypothetical protein